MRTRVMPYPIDTEREDRSKVKSAFDKDCDPTYGAGGMDRQNIDGLTFADLRDDMDARRRRMARRVSDY